MQKGCLKWELCFVPTHYGYTFIDHTVTVEVTKRYPNSTFLIQTFNKYGVNELDKNGASLFYLDLNAVIWIAT